MESRKFPKVLILTQPFNRVYGGGITLTNLFKGWPKDRIAVAGLSGLIDSNTQTDICDTYYQLGHKEYRWVAPLRWVKSKHYSGLLSFDETSSSPQVNKKVKWKANLMVKFIDPLLVKLGIYEHLYRLDLSDDFKTWLSEFEPDLIYAQAQARGRVLFCTRVQQYLGKPMVFHMMDDWLELVKNQSIFGSYWYKKSHDDFAEMLRHTALHLSISDGMSDEYERRFGYSFKAFHNPIEYGFWKRGQKESYQLASPPTILYAGRTGLGIESSLKMMAEAVKEVNRTLEIGLRFVLQTGQKEEWMDKYDFIVHRSFVSYEDLPLKFGEADILYLPYDFSEESINFIKYSMPTKASEYMASGTPILIVAPEETSLVQYAQQYGWAEVLTENSLDLIVKSLSSLLLSESRRQQLGSRGIELAKERHEAAKVREDFREALVSIL